MAARRHLVEGEGSGVDAADPAAEPIDGTTRTDGFPDGGGADRGYHRPPDESPRNGDLNGDGRLTPADSRTAYMIGMGMLSPGYLGDPLFAMAAAGAWECA